MDLVIISGGPGAGKTTLINALSAQGYMTFAEGSRTLIEEQSVRANGILPWTNLPAFAELCLALMSEQKRQTRVVHLCPRRSAATHVCRSVADSSNVGGMLP